jgi:hypothetical protein
MDTPGVGSAVPEGNKVIGQIQLGIVGKRGIIKAGKIYFLRHQGTNNGKNNPPQGGIEAPVLPYQIGQQGKGVKLRHQKTPDGHNLGGDME